MYQLLLQITVELHEFYENAVDPMSHYEWKECLVSLLAVNVYTVSLTILMQRISSGT